jgi:hypothetical protein
MVRAQDRIAFASDRPFQLFSGQAFDAPCGALDGSVLPSWVADDVTAKVNANTAASVQLKFRGKGSATVGGNFVGDDYTVTTLAGSGTQGSADLTGAAALFEGPNGLALSADGTTLFVDDRNTDPVSGANLGMTIRAIDTATGQVTTLAGSATQIGTTDGPGANARFVRLFSVALSGTDLLIADRCAIRKMSTAAPYNVTTLIGTRSTTNPNAWNCSPTVSQLSTSDLDLAVRGGNVYAADSGSNIWIGDLFSVRRMDIATAAVFTIAGDMTSSGFADGVGGAARFNAAFGIARDPRNGVIYIADQGNFAIRRLTPP